MEVRFHFEPLLEGQIRVAKVSAYNLLIFVSTGDIQWILWFSIRYATAVERFSTLMFSEENYTS